MAASFCADTATVAGLIVFRLADGDVVGKATANAGKAISKIAQQCLVNLVSRNRERIRLIKAGTISVE